jgi:integrase
MAVLHVSGKSSTLDPTPIKPDAFRKLVAGANVELRAVLLLSLNCCLYLSEALACEWAEIDLTAGTYQTRRDKTGVRRAGMLWDETITALKALSHKGQSPYLFTSSHGSVYNTNSYTKKYNRLAASVGVVDVEFNNIRDGSYTTACNKGVEFAACQMLAGHTLPGQADHYIARTPDKVQGACDAVYAAYAPIPKSQSAVKTGRPKKVA